MTYTCQRCAISRYFHHVIFVLVLKSAQARSEQQLSTHAQFITIHYSDLPMVSSSCFQCLSPSLALKILHLPILTLVVRSKSLLVVFLSWQRRFHSLAIADKHITSARTFHHKQAAPRAAAWSYLPILLASRTFMQEPHHSPKYYRGSALA